MRVLGFRVKGLGFNKDLGVWMWAPGYDVRFMVQSTGLGFRFWGLGFGGVRIWGLGFRDTLSPNHEPYTTYMVLQISLSIGGTGLAIRL